MVNKSTDRGKLISIFTITLTVLKAISVEVSRKIVHGREKQIASPSHQFHGVYSYQT